MDELDLYEPVEGEGTDRKPYTSGRWEDNLKDGAKSLQRVVRPYKRGGTFAKTSLQWRRRA